MLKKSIFILFITTLFYSANAQNHYTGFTMDNFSGSFGAFLQPADLADNRYKWNIGIGGDYNISNNYIGQNTNSFIFGNPQKSDYKKPLFGKGYYFNSLEMVPISVFFRISKKDAIGFSIKFKEYTMTDGLSDDLSLMDFTKFTEPSIIGKAFTQGKLSYQYQKWVEHTLTYARVIKDNRKEFMKAGIGFKLINGVASEYLFTNGGQVTFNQNGQVNFDGMEFFYGRDDHNNELTKTKTGVGFDFGFVYEYRPDYKKFFYRMDGKRRNPSLHKNKYKYKISGSLLNVGGVKYYKDSNSYNFINSGNNTINYKDLFNTGLRDRDYFTNNVLPNVQPTADNDKWYYMSLPTTLNLMFDYNIKKNLYVYYSGSIPIWLRSDKSKMHDLSTHTIGGRYETPFFTAGVPITLQKNGQLNIGLHARIKYVFFGVNNVNSLIGLKKMYNANAYAGLIYGIKHKKPSDKDNDKISDLKDHCVTDSGSRRMKGCPDADGDRIPDYLDFCPFTPGKKKYNGCPDTDKDGILDYEDQCPNEKGLRVNHGCPDKDKDGIIDIVDRCPEIPGVYENNGCPLTHLGCCADSDGDGLNDNIDSCVNLPGPAENNGCPVKKIRKKKEKRIRYEKIKKKPIEKVLEEAKIKIEAKTVKQTLEEMPTIDFINVYFESDKADIQKQYEEKIRGFVKKMSLHPNTLILILGHTDSDGSLGYNMKLSAKRSKAAQKYMMKLGLDESRIVIKNYGEEKPDASNDSHTNKSKNRRVEVRLMQLHD